MDSYSKYDAILGGIGLTITLMLAGFFISPLVTLAGGIAGVALAGYAMFGIPPVERVVEPEPEPQATEMMAAD